MLLLGMEIVKPEAGEIRPGRSPDARSTYSQAEFSTA